MNREKLKEAALKQYSGQIHVDDKMDVAFARGFDAGYDARNEWHKIDAKPLVDRLNQVLALNRQAKMIVVPRDLVRSCRDALAITAVYQED